MYRRKLGLLKNGNASAKLRFSHRATMPYTTVNSEAVIPRFCGNNRENRRCAGSER